MLGQNLVSLSTEFHLECLKLVLEHSMDQLAENFHVHNSSEGPVELFRIVGRDGFGRFPLHLAAAYNDSSAVKLLVQYGFQNFQSQDNSGYTPLHLACLKGIIKRHLNVFDI